jgi:hypothetical protein
MRHGGYALDSSRLVSLAMSGVDPSLQKQFVGTKYVTRRKSTNLSKILENADA